MRDGWMRLGNVARDIAQATRPGLPAEGHVAERGRSHEGPGRVREETPKEGMHPKVRRTGQAARISRDTDPSGVREAIDGAVRLV